MAVICTVLKGDLLIVAIAFQVVHWSRLTADGSKQPKSSDPLRRSIVLDALKGVCLHRSWTLLAAHVRSNHVHVVVEADIRPEKIMNALKSYASCALNQLHLDSDGRNRWTRHGSTRWIRDDKHVAVAIRYVVDQQREPMAVFELDCQ